MRIVNQLQNTSLESIITSTDLNPNAHKLFFKHNYLTYNKKAESWNVVTLNAFERLFRKFGFYKSTRLETVCEGMARHNWQRVDRNTVDFAQRVDALWQNKYGSSSIIDISGLAARCRNAENASSLNQPNRSTAQVTVPPQAQMPENSPSSSRLPEIFDESLPARPAFSSTTLFERPISSLSLIPPTSVSPLAPQPPAANLSLPTPLDLVLCPPLNLTSSDFCTFPARPQPPIPLPHIFDESRPAPRPFSSTSVCEPPISDLSFIPPMPSASTLAPQSAAAHSAMPTPRDLVLCPTLNLSRNGEHSFHTRPQLPEISYGLNSSRDSRGNTIRSYGRVNINGREYDASGTLNVVSNGSRTWVNGRELGTHIRASSSPLHNPIFVDV